MPAFRARCPRAHVGGPSRTWRDRRDRRDLDFWRDLDGPTGVKDAFLEEGPTKVGFREREREITGTVRTCLHNQIHGSRLQCLCSVHHALQGACYLRAACGS